MTTIQLPVKGTKHARCIHTAHSAHRPGPCESSKKNSCENGGTAPHSSLGWRRKPRQILCCADVATERRRTAEEPRRSPPTQAAAERRSLVATRLPAQVRWTQVAGSMLGEDVLEYLGRGGYDVRGVGDVGPPFLDENIWDAGQGRGGPKPQTMPATTSMAALQTLAGMPVLHGRDPQHKSHGWRCVCGWAYFKSAYLGPSSRVCRGCFFSMAVTDTPSEGKRTPDRIGRFWTSKGAQCCLSPGP